MKATKWQRTVSLLLCLLMAMSFFVVTAPKAYAAEPTWPYLESVNIEDCTFTNWKLRSDFPAAEDNLKKIEILHVSTLKECPEVKTAGATTTYHAGTIALYVETLPTAKDKDPTASATAKFGFQFAIKADGSPGSYKSKVTLKNTGENYTEKFYGECNVKFDADFRVHDEASYYIMTADKTAYHYDVQVKQYTGEAGEELTLSVGSAKRTDKEKATVTFNASAAGNYYYALCDEQQTTPVVDTTSANTNTGTMAKTNTIIVSGMTDCKTKYLYIVGVDAAGKPSAPLEIVIPSVKFKLKHDQQGLRGLTVIDESENILNGWLYTEEFRDASDKPITEAVAGELVTVNFGAFKINAATPLGSVHYDKDADVITSATGIRQHVLKKWNITGLGEFTTTERSFTFTMPENDVTIQAETELSGVPIQLKSSDANVQATLDCSVQLGSGSGNACYYSDKRDCLVAGASVTLRAYSIADGYVLDKWKITSNGTPVDESKITRNEDGSAELTLEAGGDYVFTAVLREKKFASVTAEVNNSTMGSATVTVGENTGTSLPLVYEGQSVILTAAPGSRYMLERWEVKDAADNAIDTTAVEGEANKATFVMPSTGSAITAKAFFKVDLEQASTENALTAVELDVPGAAVSRSGSTFTITLPAGTNTSKLSEKILKLTISDFATVTKEGDPDKDWTEGAACGMELDKAATFTVTAEKGNTQAYTIIITKAKSSEKDITAAVLLNQTGDTTPFARAEISETEITFTLPSDTDKAVLNRIGMKYLKLTYPESATVKMKDGYDDATNGGYRWSNGDVMCNMSINSPVKFTVTAEDSSTKEYTIEIKYTAPNAPTLSNGSATRTSKTGATVKFTSSEAGNYFYKVVDHGAAAPTVDTSKNGTSAVQGENTITLSNLTEDARDIYIVVVSAAGGESAPLKVEIPAYGSGTDTPDTGAYKISISAPKGGTITTNRTKANAGDEIIVTVTPDSGYQMVSGSLTYTLAIAGGETKTITNGRFTMPAGDVSITCKWETATTTAKGITSFSINGVAGAVNNSTNTITITMPRGTDVTKLTPVIATNGVKSLTPGNGETVNFTNAVTYTAAMEDGSSKTYTVTVYVDKGTLADQFWDKLTDFATQVPWWQYAEKQQSTSKYPKYW